MQKGQGLEHISTEQILAEQIASEFINYLNAFHKKGIQNDNEVLIQLYKEYIAQLENMKAPNFGGTHHFRSSSTGACAREHYMRLKRYSPDKRETTAQHTRWQNLGTRIGDMIQFDLLLAEKHMPKPKFRFERVSKGIDFDGIDHLFPHFEEFSTVSKFLQHKGKEFFLHGSTDGIMVYTTPEGKQIRVGLEVKSKQTSYSRTSLHSMKAVDYKHKRQTISYSLMFGVDYWIVLYVNASKKSWSPTEEDMIKTPDIRAFGHYVTEEMRQEVLDRFAWICDCVDNNIAPPLELNNWTFNNYKKACAESLSIAEFLSLIDYVENETSHFPAFMQKQMQEAVEKIADFKGL